MARTNIDFREQPNQDCLKCSNRDIRKKYSHIGICDRVTSRLDGFPVRCVGNWGQKKVFLLLQYLGIFAQGMKNSWNGKLHYLEICSGPGRLIDFGSGNEFDGSALAVLRHDCAKLLKSAIFVDYNPEVVEALNQRISQMGDLGRLQPQAFEGDYNSVESLEKILSVRDNDGLNLIFLDPTDLSLPFSTIEYLVRKLNKVDLMINVPIDHDFRRNAKGVVLEVEFEKSRRKYETFLGSPGFFRQPEVYDCLMSSSKGTRDLSRLFMEQYKKRLSDLGYAHFRTHKIEHYYDILFASSNAMGAKFWDKSQKIGFDGQRNLF